MPEWELIQQITAHEGYSVEIVYDSPDFVGPNSLVIVHNVFDIDKDGNGGEHRFGADTRLEALTRAARFVEKRENNHA